MKQKRKAQVEATSGTRRSTRQRRLVQQTLFTAGGRASGSSRATAATAARAGPQPQAEPGNAQQLHELREVSVRQALRGSSFSATFERQYVGWAVSASCIRNAA